MEHESYTGHVEPGGESSSRTIEVDGATVEIRKLSVGPMDNNVYVLSDTAAGQALIIDAANDAERILEAVEGLDVVGIVTTHGHRDHWQALAEVAAGTGADVHVHRDDMDMIPHATDAAVEDRSELRFGEATLRAIHTPGHTPGSICLLLGERHLFTGDTLFPGGPGNTFGNSRAFTTIMHSLRERIFGLDDETWVYPGHGDDTTIGRERPSLGAWQQRGW